MTRSYFDVYLLLLYLLLYTTSSISFLNSFLYCNFQHKHLHFFWGRNICMHLCRGHNMHECKGINVKAWSSENILIYRLYGQRVNNTIEILVVVWWCQISKSFLLMANFSQGRLKTRISARMQWPPMQNTNRASDWLYRRRPVGWMVDLT